MTGYIFGGDTNLTYEDIQRRRRIADSMTMSMGAPRNVGEGLTAIGKALAIRGMNRQADKADEKLRGEFNNQWASLFGGGSQASGQRSGSFGTPFIPPPDDEVTALGADTMAALGRVNPTPSQGEMVDYIRQSAKARGIDPETAVRVAASEGLKANPNEAWQSNVVKNGKRERSYGPYQLYIDGGLGNNFMEDTGLDPRDASTWQQQVDYALDHAAKNGWGAWYGAKAIGLDNMAGIGGAPAGGVRTAQFGGMSIENLAGVAGSPYATPGQKAVAQALLQQQMQANDPAYQLDLERSRLELEQMRNPQGYRQVTGPEAEAMGLDPAFAYNVSPDGKATQIGGSSTNITLKNEGTIPSGYRAVRDDNGNLVGYEPVPGGPEDTTTFDEKAQETKENQANLVLDEIAIAKDLIGGQSILSPATGITGALASNIDSTRAGSLKNRLTTIKANIGFDKLQAMRDASPTGGALGQVSEFENRLLQAVFGSLEQAQSAEDITYNLERLEGIYTRIIHEGIGDDEARAMYRELATGQSPEDTVGRGKVAEKQTGTIDFAADKPPSGLSGDDADLWKYATPEERKAIWGQ